MGGTLAAGAGTPEYAAPEVFNPIAKGPEAARQLPKIDVYSFCVTLHHVMSKVKPFADCANVMQIMFAAAQGRRPDASLLDARISESVAQGWSANPEQRPTMQELLATLDPAAAMLARDEQEARDEASACVVCMERPRSHVLIPCGHFCVCEDHAAAVRQCPLCRADVASRHKLWQ